MKQLKLVDNKSGFDCGGCYYVNAEGVCDHPYLFLDELMCNVNTIFVEQEEQE